MKVGYCRSSSIGQNNEYQIVALKEAGCEKIFIDKQSGKDANRPALKEMLSFIREGDTCVVHAISRLARNTKDLLNIVETITEKGAEFVSLSEAIDTSTASGRFMLTIFGAMATMEREYIKDKQAEGIAIAKEAGKYKGKPKMLIDEDAFKRECKKWREGKQTATETMKRLNIKPNTFYRRVKEMAI